MCGLCGVLGGAAHWSEGVAMAGGPGAAGPWVRRQARQRSIALANALLSRHRITVRDWQSASFLVTGPTGRTEFADDLDALWTRVHAILGRPIDPLDPALLEACDG